MFHAPHFAGRTGYRPSYRVDELNRCPGCGGAQWYVGRITAECAFCGAALPIAEAGNIGARLSITAQAA